jgi:hypothetical protein
LELNVCQPNARGLSVIVTSHAVQAFSALDWPTSPANCRLRHDQLIGEALMMAFAMRMTQVGLDGIPERRFSHSLAQRQVEEQAECERGLNGHVRIHGLRPALSGLRRGPGVDGLVADPQGEVATIAE